MSTYLYLKCLDHDPPLFAADESGRRNMYTDAPANARQRLQREGVVDLGRRRVVDQA